jgi:hypothetical protein
VQRRQDERDFFKNAPWKVYQSYRRKAKTTGTTQRRLQLHTYTTKQDNTEAWLQLQGNPANILLLMPLEETVRRRQGCNGLTEDTDQDASEMSYIAPRKTNP